MIRNSFGFGILKFRRLKSKPPDSWGCLSGQFYIKLKKLCGVGKNSCFHIKCVPIGYLKYQKASPLSTINAWFRCQYFPICLFCYFCSINWIQMLMISKPRHSCWSFPKVLLLLLLLIQKTHWLWWRLVDWHQCKSTISVVIHEQGYLWAPKGAGRHTIYVYQIM